MGIFNSKKTVIIPIKIKPINPKLSKNAGCKNFGI